MKLTTSLVMFAAMATSAFATTVSFNLFNDITARSATAGNLLDSSYTLYIGTYAGAPTTLATTTNFATINASFSQIASIAFATGDAAGYNGWAQINGTTFTNDATFGNKPLYAWISNGSNLNSVMTGFGNIPVQAAIPNTLDAVLQASTIGTVTQVLGTYNAAGAGSPTGPNGAYGSGGNIVLNNSAIPEPSAALLGALGALGLLRRRRI